MTEVAAGGRLAGIVRLLDAKLNALYVFDGQNVLVGYTLTWVPCCPKHAIQS